MIPPVQAEAGGVVPFERKRVMDNRLENDGEIEIVRMDGKEFGGTAAGPASGETSGVPENGGAEPPVKKKKKKAAKVVIIIIAVLLLLVIAAVLTVSGIFNKYVDKINYTHDPYDPHDTGPIAIDSLPPDFFDEPTEVPATPEPGATQGPTSLPTEIPTGFIPPTHDAEDDFLMMDDRVLNVLIIGSDSRDLNTFRGNSDVMMMLSINKKTRKLWITSFQRDTYLHVPGIGYNKLNSAYPYSGAKLLQRTLQENYLVVIPYYVIVNFESFTEIVDDIGGVEIKISDGEAKYISGIDKGGTYVLNGEQALQYSRIRYLDSDFYRTQRQRNVMTKVIEKLRGRGVTELMGIMDSLLPLMTTNMPRNELTALIRNVGEYSKYPLNELRIPIDGTWHYDYLPKVTHVVIVESFWKNIVAIRDKVYEGIYS